MLNSALTIILDFVVFFIALFFLVKGTDLVTDSLDQLSKKSKMQVYALSSFFSAIATSLPELLVAVSGALAGRPYLAVGLLLGSNIANITIAIGMASTIGGTLNVLDDFVKKDVLVAFIMTLFPVVLAMDMKISRLDGVFLIIFFVLYYVLIFRNTKNIPQEDDQGMIDNLKNWAQKLWGVKVRKQIGFLIVGLLILLYSADIVVKSGAALAVDFKLPIFLIGMFFAAFGTSLPEIVFGIGATKRGEAGMVFGNLLGSLVANSTLILGLTAIINPIDLVKIIDSSIVAIVVYIASFALLWFFIRTKLKLQRWEGIVLCLVYILFILGELYLH
jgi:cation:H+ antiporter